MQALQQTEQALREVVQDRQAKYGEIRVLQHQVASSEAREQELKSRLENVESDARSLEERAEASQRRLQEAEGRCDELEARLAAAEAQRQAAERRADAAALAAEAQARGAAEAEHQCELRATERVEEARRSLADLDRRREEELRAGLEELRVMAETQQALRSELRRASRPPRFAPEDFAEPSEPGVPSPFPSQKVWDTAMEITRGRGPKLAWSSERELAQRLPYRSTGGSLLDGRVRAQADIIMAQVAAIQGRRARPVEGTPGRNW